jgi:hypothetical protein
MRTWLVGFGYWLLFLLALEPGNIFGAKGSLDAGHEIIRIIAAALLGSSITPAVLASIRRFPVVGKAIWRHALIQLSGSLAGSAGLMVMSCVLAEILFASHQSFAAALRREFEFNWLLVTFCTLTFIGFCHTPFARRLLGIGIRPVSSATAYISEIAVKVRNERTYLPLSSVDWIEAQGNYLALHEATRIHLVRDSLENIAATLDPREFVRIHRGVIVSIKSVEGISPLGSGDAKLRLKQGTELRLSRTYRAAFLKIWRR